MSILHFILTSCNGALWIESDIIRSRVLRSIEHLCIRVSVHGQGFCRERNSTQNDPSRPRFISNRVFGTNTCRSPRLHCQKMLPIPPALPRLHAIRPSSRRVFFNRVAEVWRTSHSRDPRCYHNLILEPGNPNSGTPELVLKKDHVAPSILSRSDQSSLLRAPCS